MANRPHSTTSVIVGQSLIHHLAQLDVHSEQVQAWAGILRNIGCAPCVIQPSELLVIGLALESLADVLCDHSRAAYDVATGQEHLQGADA